MDGQQLSQFISDAQQAVWASREVRGQLQKNQVAVIPANFYSNIPSLEEISESFEYKDENVPPYLDSGIFDSLSLRDELINLADYSVDFDPPKDGDVENPTAFFWSNDQFPFIDGMAYHAVLRKLKPRNVVEIGSGFSSLVALEALRRNGVGKLTCIEPFPRRFLEDRAKKGEIRLIQKKAQTFGDLNDFLEDGDVLFIDSTHTVKIGSDCLHLYLRLLPKIKRRIWVHVHDIFLPFGMPADWARDLHIYWTEQYLLLAFLLDNPKATVKFGAKYHEYVDREFLERTFMHGRSPSNGGSLWFEYDGTK
ncbi:class I SAM-dependent methyltransferase [Achromobacter sp. ACM04]|uniref:Class I SAM-dependent methyltransferase n=1 Tax=Achromobacter aegrifaciens TaxID=1287736 RepID=A0ABU2D904_ACHAE|nr:class I SAM-dependent methyltransferase [Achromobacter aegrifaciens]MBD9384924.1 class I SAM-dependent methyltransferase [Achromobacter sp. ACM02]MBD9423305.1 class I SAM-dependent methyltransferase [Achromobacter sp. ACM04]MDR7944584.1 class I SAM-dependent methyltransferase [Achromobacter aegrifaciens]